MCVCSTFPRPAARISASDEERGFRVRDAKTGKGQLALGFEIKTNGKTGTFPLLVTRDGAKSQSDLKLTAPVAAADDEVRRAEARSGRRLGKDSNCPRTTTPPDNTAYFVHRPPNPLHTSQ